MLEEKNTPELNTESARITRLRDKSNSLPLLPGVYIMKDAKSEIIYIGKAKRLKNRVSSYFHGSHNAKTEAMAGKVSDFDVIVVNSEFEALVLENRLIKHHKPKYNILLKDDKGYPFIRIDLDKDYPVFEVVGKKKKEKYGAHVRYLGPFGGRGSAFAAIETVQKTLKMPSCRRVFPRDIGKERPCLNLHMGLCLGFCEAGHDKDERRETYRALLDTALSVFDGDTKALVSSLTDDMTACAENLQFEKAAAIRDKLRAVQSLTRKQVILTGTRADTDAVGYFEGEAKACFTVLHYSGGGLLSKDSELIETPLEEGAEAVSALLRQYYAQRGEYPKLVLLPLPSEDAAGLSQLFTESSGHKVDVLCPQRGEKRRFMETAELNAQEEVRLFMGREDRVRKTAEWLADALALPSAPSRIEAYDISNLGNDDIVASMIVFEDGKPKRASYRTFRMKSVSSQDDYGSMFEAVSRRAEHAVTDDPKFPPLPDVFFIDGGVVHAQTARRALLEKGIAVPVFGMVKDARHRTRALVSVDGAEIGLTGNPAAFSLVGKIQEEAHRFANKYREKLADKRTYVSELDAIPGLGKVLREKLLAEFGSLERINAASPEGLRAVV
ncbi:MAG: excinuclease ABC subunit UvrC, partial [Oscillospiraceae bacterium]|nr:excinuclease ABC subunit UvrC [Oscillospiraceae bacterium]